MQPIKIHISTERPLRDYVGRLVVSLRHLEFRVARINSEPVNAYLYIVYVIIPRGSRPTRVHFAHVVDNSADPNDCFRSKTPNANKWPAPYRVLYVPASMRGDKYTTMISRKNGRNRFSNIYSHETTDSMTHYDHYESAVVRRPIATVPR